MAYEIVAGRSPKEKERLGLAGTIFLGKHYVEMGKTGFSVVSGQWYDTGTIDSLLESALQIKKKISEKN